MSSLKYNNLTGELRLHNDPIIAGFESRGHIPSAGFERKGVDLVHKLGRVYRQNQITDIF